MTPSKDSLKLQPITRVKEAPHILYRLLATRSKQVNISHRKMPSYAQHLAFLKRRPYKAWYLLHAPSLGFVGSVYLSKGDEIGIFLFKEYQGKGFGREAAALLMAKHRKIKRFIANINPKNERSILFFKEMGFIHIQNTYELVKGRS